MSTSPLLRRYLPVGLAAVLVAVLALVAVLGVQDILASPRVGRGAAVSVLGPLLISVASVLLLRRDPLNRLRSAVILGLLSGLLAYSLAAICFFVLGSYPAARLVTGPLVVGAWFALTGLVALSAPIVYVVHAEHPRPAIAISLTAIVYLSPLPMFVGPVVAMLVYWKRAWLDGFSLP